MKRKNDYGTLLMWSAALVAAPRYAGAFLAADVGEITGWVSEGLHIANVVSGLGMGVLEVISVAYMLDALRQSKPLITRTSGRTSVNYRWWGTALFAVGLLILTPFILAPYIVARMNGIGIGSELSIAAAQYIWGVAVVVAPAFVVGGVAFARSGLVSSADDAGGASQMRAGAPQGGGGQNRSFTCHCARTFDSSQAYAGHAKRCAVRAEALAAVATVQREGRE